ncbi:nucleotidyltransferase family protein [Gracilimonas sp.]|uniref:nucleotidyltransferase family protein n=1 Tax=Gracilimonas sp. TaxID=1974203 RepID=UPI0028726B83|nr:nucleotidyltransferase domain-containing protein [Gracilimonas sp.]
MDMTLKNKISEYFKHKPVLKAYLFGSQLREDVRLDSDIDILVKLDHSVPIGLKFVQMQLEMQDLLEKNVDLLTPQSISKYIKEDVDREKELIYER